MRKSVLIVDDDLGFVQQIAEQLEPFGYRLMCALDGGLALSVLDALGSEIDVAVIDLALPKVSGPELIGFIRRNRRKTRTRVLAITGCLKPAVLEGTLQLGADAAVLKKGANTEIVEAIKRLAELESAEAAAG